MGDSRVGCQASAGWPLKHEVPANRVVSDGRTVALKRPAEFAYVAVGESHVAGRVPVVAKTQVAVVGVAVGRWIDVAPGRADPAGMHEYRLAVPVRARRDASERVARQVETELRYGRAVQETLGVD